MYWIEIQLTRPPTKRAGPRVSPTLLKSYFLHYGFLSQLAKADLLAKPGLLCNSPSCQSEPVRVLFSFVGSIDACLGKEEDLGEKRKGGAFHGVFRT